MRKNLKGAYKATSTIDYPWRKVVYASRTSIEKDVEQHVNVHVSVRSWSLCEGITFNVHGWLGDVLTF